MNTKKLLFSLFLLLLLIMNIVNAAEDFTASAKSSVELCPCSNQAYSVNVQNTGSVQNSYTVLASGDAAEWITFNPSKFVLNPGQKGSFFVIVNSVCNIEGDFNFDIFITTNNGLTKVVRQSLMFTRCYDYSLDQGKVVEEVEESLNFLQHDSSYSLCRDEQKSIPVLITNNENFENRYKLFLDSPEWTGLNVNSISLGAKKSGIFLINFDTTNIGGEFDFKLNVISELGKVQRKKNIGVNVQDCYALELDLKEEDIICGGEKKNYDIIIKNPVTFEKNVKLELDAPEWVNVQNASFYLGPVKEKTLTLNANPEDDVSGSFLVKVSALIEDKTRLVDDLKLDVTPKLVCYEADISTKASVTNFYSQDFFSAKVKNNGIKKATYDVSLEGPSWVSVSPDTLELNPGQTGNLNLIVNPGTDVNPETYGIKINLESNDAVYSKSVDIVLRKENEFVKKLKATLKIYQYYIYILIVIIILIIIFRKQISKVKNNTKKGYEKYKIKTERLKALKLARKEREEEKKKKKELEEKIKEQDITRKKELDRKKEKRIKKKDIFKKLPIGKVLIYVALLIASVIFIGHENKLFNAKYLHIYIINLFYGYLYYILMGVGTVIVLFLLVLLYNFISKKGKKKIKKEVKKAEKKAKKKEEWYSKPFYVIVVFIPIMILLAALAYLNLFDDIKDFVILYSYYFGLGTAILVILILLIRFYKPLFKFLKE